MIYAQQVEFLIAGVRDTSGTPLAAGKIYSYEAGSVTNKALYTAADMSTSAANPLILDAYGRSQVWAYGPYKFVVKDSSDNTLYTFDNMRYGYGFPDVHGASDTGSTNAYATSTGIQLPAYYAGMRVTFVAANTNTGASTINVDGLGVKNIRLYAGSTALSGGEIVSGAIVDLVYDGTQFILMRPATLGMVRKTGITNSTSVISSTSASYTDYNSTGLPITLDVLRGESVFLSASISVSHSVANTQMLLRFTENGTYVGTEQTVSAFRSSTGGLDTVITTTAIVTPASAGSYTYKIQWLPNGATGYSVRAVFTAHVIGAF